MEDTEAVFSDAAKGELANLSDEAKNLVVHIVHGAALDLQIAREHVLAIGGRFNAFFGAAKTAVDGAAAPPAPAADPAPQPAESNIPPAPAPAAPPAA